MTLNRILTPLLFILSLSCSTDSDDLVAPPPGNDVNLGFPPTQFAMSLPTPNPFRGSTQVTIAVPQESILKVIVQSSKGVTIRTLREEEVSAGYYTETWDGKTSGGGRCNVGIYFITAQAGTSRGSHPVKLDR